MAALIMLPDLCSQIYRINSNQCLGHKNPGLNSGKHKICRYFKLLLSHECCDSTVLYICLYKINLLQQKPDKWAYRVHGWMDRHVQ